MTLQERISAGFAAVGADIKALRQNAGVGGGGAVVQGCKPTLQGDATPHVAQTKAYQITNFNSFSTYAVAVSAGTATIHGDTIEFTAPSTAGNVDLTLTVDDDPTVFVISVQSAGVDTPTNLSPAAGAISLGVSPVLRSSTFYTFGTPDTHQASRWTLYQGGIQVHSSGWRTDALLTYTVPAGVVMAATTYTWTVEHQGQALGNSAPSTPTAFTTPASFGGDIGVAGSQGFGVGEYPGTLPAGFSTMVGTSDKASAKYGNYLYMDGSEMVFVPKFYYRIGSTSSPRYVPYGLNAIDIAGVNDFADEAAANAAGYALHRAFKDGGVVKSGFFMDKYLASKDGIASCKSVANADPISLVAVGSYNPSSTQTGCTGILADAVVLARTRGARGGAGFNVASIFMYDALAKLSLAHGQAATGSANCAWYSTTGTTNFPKGCNNGSLADVNDPSVTYAASYSAKPKTRATAGFAKTTHNGQECGVADINGCMYQVMLGVTQAGASATDAASISTGNAYVLKPSVALASLTGGFGGATDAWGTTSSLTTSYDLIAGFLPWGGTSTSDYFGNGANQVFSPATSGTDYLRCCCGIPVTSGTSAAGTNQFGIDAFYRTGLASVFPVASSHWSDSVSAGVFARRWSFGRTNGSTNIGFRAAAYGD